MGPNDYGYINQHVRKAAAEIKHAMEIWCEGHYAHSNAKSIPWDHPLVKALSALSDVDFDTAGYDNKEHDPSLFARHQPTEAAMHRWDGTEGPPGEAEDTPAK